MSLYLRQISIENFRTFGKFNLELPGVPGLLIVTGPNGVGKSSFFDAIEWALTGRAARFEKYRKRETEAVYLTRDGCRAFCHSASLKFNIGESVERRGSPKGPIGTTDQALKSILVDPAWKQEIKDLWTYLSLTHFLGQASQQRFISREGPAQWSALRTPSGVETLEFVWKRLRGRPAIMAFNRKEDAAEKEANQNADRLAHWDALIGRLRRLESNAELAGALPREQIVRELEEVYKRYSVFMPESETHVSGDPARVLNSLRASIVDSHKEINSEESGLLKLAILPNQFDNLSTRQFAVSERLVGLRASKRDSETILGARLQDFERIDKERSQLLAQSQRHSERLSVLSGAQADLHIAAQANDRKENLEKSRLAEEVAHIAYTAEKEKAEAEFEQLRIARDAVSAATERHQAADSLVGETEKLADLESQLATAKARLLQAAAEESKHQAIDWDSQEAAASNELRIRGSDLRELRDRVGAMSAALVAISLHLRHEDTECPVCKSHFQPGELLQLAESAASVTDSALPTAQALHDQAALAFQGVLSERQAGSRLTAEKRAATRAVEHAQKNLDSLRKELLARLNISDKDGDIREIAAAKEAQAAAELDGARRALAVLEATATEVQQRHSQSRERYQTSVSHLADLRTRLSRAVDEAGSALRRFHVRVGEEGLKPEDIAVLLAQAQTVVDSHEEGLKLSAAAYAAANASLLEARMEDARLAGSIKQQEQAEGQLLAEINRLSETWTGAGLPLPPSSGVFEDRTSDLKARRMLLEQIDIDRQRLASALEASASREELKSVAAAVADEIGKETIEDYRRGLEASVSNARTQVARTKATHEAILLLADRLQGQADQYSNDFLRPLNELISAFNDALLISPGPSVFFNAEYFADRTEFTTRLQQRRKSGAPTEVRAINPHFVLSEGQLAANGLSMLCSASVSYPWSQWPALLLDDPLQHNDVIHAAAFADMMRNLVALKGYEVLMSSHDRGETEFLERKFTEHGHHS